MLFSATLIFAKFLMIHVLRLVFPMMADLVGELLIIKPVFGVQVITFLLIKLLRGDGFPAIGYLERLISVPVSEAVV